MKPRSMIAKFHYHQDKEKVWNSRKNLKGKKFFLEEDFPEETREIRKFMTPIMCEARRLTMKATINVDKLIVDGRVYTYENLKNLPAHHPLNPQKVATPDIADNMVAFFTGESPLSNHFISNQKVNGVLYHSNEQFYLASKAKFVDDMDSYDKIMAATTPGRCKVISHNIKGELTHWNDTESFKVMKQGLMAKFSQNPALRSFLLTTANKQLVEANPRDPIWGVGLSLKQRDLIADIKNWKGANQLGKALQEVREHLIDK